MKTYKVHSKARRHLPPAWRALVLAAILILSAAPAIADYPVKRPERVIPAATESAITVYPDKIKQVIHGLGFEIQSDSIASGNKGLPGATTSVPHDLIPSERERFYTEMLKGFRYCRLAGGLYWRGLDPEQKSLQGRWPGQADELREMLSKSGLEGVAFEYWSPAPYWKSNRQYIGGKDTENVLRCFGKDFANDPDYHGDVDRFLADFAQACLHDLATLKTAGIPVVAWGLQNEPSVNTFYSSCTYKPETYARTFLAVAPVIRAFDPKISIYADSWNLRFIKPVLKDPEQSKLVDALAVHVVGTDSDHIVPRTDNFPQPEFQNEFEYLNGPTSPDRCLNTVQQIMNWFQLRGAQTWYWIHALKPTTNVEASGYSLGFWRPVDESSSADDPKFPGLKAGCWTWNKYNWNAVGSFLRHMPWDCQAVKVTENASDPDLRILAFKRPNGKLTFVLSNRSGSDHTFRVTTGLPNATFKGYRYTPDDEPSPECPGKEIGSLSDAVLSPVLADRTWEFWEQQ